MKFFRRIRQKLLSENKFSKYLVYAIGEIVLVVIGILIALGINNYNQEQILRKKEQVYLNGLKDEFQTSKRKLTELISVNHANYNEAKQIIEIITAGREPSEADFSKLLFNAFAFEISFNPNNSLINEMINSGNLNNIRNPELRQKLTNWFAMLQDISKQETELGMQREKVLNMFSSNEHSLRTIFEHTGMFRELELTEEQNKISNLGLLNSTKFENNVLMFISASHSTEHTHYKTLMQEINSILSLISLEINE
ncbi:DUF6090 family protein [Gramella sp. GC03-9]|uniref:DUF6090 family protein n=1 Tax=Christiangramia oceanisediminis TaxID=2920386 RepID=A0A9X2KYS3_9FLAO|nr:DUF6090 family protein [Gramella oceanisediminis]MCP9200838.1 DUF6090 family protein [Gramella oceanisediminis]